MSATISIAHRADCYRLARERRKHHLEVVVMRPAVCYGVGREGTMRGSILTPAPTSTVGLTTGRAPFVESARNRGEMYITQPYELYTDENHESWHRLYARMHQRWERYANRHFLDGLQALDLPARRIPRLEEIN